MGHILTVYTKTTITIITKLRLDHRVVQNVPIKFQSCRFNGLGGVALQQNTFLTSNNFLVIWGLASFSTITYFAFKQPLGCLAGVSAHVKSGYNIFFYIILNHIFKYERFYFNVDERVP